MNEFNRHLEMIELVADALGPDLLAQTAFVGGCTTGLLITDRFTREVIRYTDDVDLIVSVLGYPQWHQLCAQLQQRGFRIAMGESVNCRFRLNGLQVDFMPDDETVLGFSNRWYTQALRVAEVVELPSSTRIRVVTPPYFVATKLEAYKGRGKGDPLSSHDIEDLLNLVDGRAELLGELQRTETALREYLAGEFTQLLEHRDFIYAVQSTAGGSTERESIIFNRLEQIAALL